MKLPFFAPVRTGPFVAHCEPLGEMILFWVYDTRRYSDPLVTGLEACCYHECCWPKSKRHAKARSMAHAARVGG